MKQVNAIGWYGHRNIGDESYRLSFPRLFPDASFSFSDLDTQPQRCDNAVLGGGDILYPAYVDRLLKIPASRRVILSVSANNSAPIDLLKQVDQIFVRDQRSADLLKSKGLTCNLMPDASLCLQPNADAGRQWLKTQYSENGLELYQKRVGVVLNAHLYHSEPDLLARDFLTLMKCVWELGKLADNTSASFIFFPMSTQMPNDDRIPNAMISGRCKFWRKNLMIHERLTVQQTLDLIAACDVVISTRLHSTLFSVISETPFIDLTHHDKNRGYLNSLGLADWSESYWCCCYDKLKQLLQERLTNKGQYENVLKTIHARQVQELQQGADNVYFV
jgi:polysaccharide pyruvyl transferase WcaK-like protein